MQAVESMVKSLQIYMVNVLVTLFKQGVPLWDVQFGTGSSAKLLTYQ